MNTFPPSETGKNRAVTARLRVARLLGSARGSALVISLVFIILITIAIVGFVTTATLERKTVQSHYGRVQAALYNTMAVDVVASRITQATTGTNSWWVSQPGRISSTPFATSSATSSSLNSGATAPWMTTFVDLTSGASTAAQEDISVNLNPGSFTQGTGLLAADAAKSLPVRWIYIRKNGGQEVSGTNAPAYDSSDPIVGRYAYWTDDESSRININTATSSTTPESEAATHPSRVDLTTLSPLTAADIQNVRASRVNRLFNSVDEIRSVDSAPNAAAALFANKEALTHFNHSSDLNRFGEPRIVLTTQANLAGGMPYFDILQGGKENTDPGIDASIDPAKVTALFAKLYPYFSKRACDWGLVYPPQSNYWSKTLAQKYDPRFVAGIILNIIDYVRAVESAETLVLPLRAAFDPSTGVLSYNVFGYGSAGSFGPNGLRGNSRRLHIVEMGLWLPAAPVAGVFQGKLKTRIYLPVNAGRSIDIVPSGLALQSLFKPTTGGTYSTADVAITAAHLSGASSLMQPGEYRTITQPANIPSASRPEKVLMRLAIKNAVGGTSYDFAPLEQSETLGKYVEYTIDPAAVAETSITSRSSDDPAVNQCFADWTPKKVPGVQQTNKFGTQELTPESTLNQAAPLGIPQQDATSLGNLTNVSTILPPPKGTAGNPTGLIGSVGDLGRVHTGCAGTSLAGKPWRTLRLQPRYAPNGSLPDWVLLDLFTIPLQARNKADRSVFWPAGGTVGGRINLNSKVYPFLPAQISREQPLRAVIQGADGDATTEQVNETTAEILGFDGTAATLATGSTTTGAAFGTTAFTQNGLFAMPAAVCEVRGIADGGEESEALVRGLVGFLTTQSNVFSVYSVGQKIQQLPNGTIKILGESRNRSLLERYQDGIDWKVRVVSTTELGI